MSAALAARAGLASCRRGRLKCAVSRHSSRAVPLSPEGAAKNPASAAPSGTSSTRSNCPPAMSSGRATAPFNDRWALPAASRASIGNGAEAPCTSLPSAPSLASRRAVLRPREIAPVSRASASGGTTNSSPSSRSPGSSQPRSPAPALSVNAPSGGSAPGAVPSSGPAWPARVKSMPLKRQTAARSLALLALRWLMLRRGIWIWRAGPPGRVMTESVRLIWPIRGAAPGGLGAAASLRAGREGLAASGSAQSLGSRLSFSPSASTPGISRPPPKREKSETLAASLGATKPGTAAPGVLSVTSRNSSLGISPSVSPSPPILAR